MATFAANVLKEGESFAWGVGFDREVVGPVQFLLDYGLGFEHILEAAMRLRGANW